MEKKQSGKKKKKNLREGDYPTHVGRPDSGSSVARVESFTPPTVPSHDLGLTKLAEDTLSLVGQKAHEEKELMDVSSLLKPTP